MITKKHLELLWNIETACRRCSRAAHYCQAVSDTNTRLWAFTQNSFGGICVVYWCQIFGSHDEPTHYSKLFDGSCDLPIAKVDVAARLRNSISMTEEDYKGFWQGVKDARDKFFVHNEFDETAKPVFPDLELMVKVCMEMRLVVSELLATCKSEDPKLQKRIEHWVTHFSNEVFLKDVMDDVPILKNAATINWKPPKG